MELRPGYKQTEIGIIPQDWELKPLSELASVTAGGTPSRTNAKYWNGDIPWVTTSEVDFNTIHHAEQLITKEGLNNSAARLLPSGTLLMALYGQGKTRGKVCILGIEAATNQACAAISLKPRVSQEFIFHFLASRYDAIRNLSNTGNQENLNSSLVRSISVSLPPQAEQGAIAAALSDVDALLEGLTRLIAKKRDLKQAAMQRLLTGQTRLPGFHGEWEAKTLAELFDFSAGYSASREQLSAEGYCYLHYGDIHGTTKTYIDTEADYQDIPKLDISLKRVSPSSLLNDGDVVFVDASEDHEGTSRHVVVSNKTKVPFISGLHTIVAKSKTNELAHAYRRYCFQTTDIRQQFLFYSVGTKVSGISKTNIPKLTIPVPLLPEQAAIATVLSDMDAELAALVARRDKTRALKQAMMQELLTGRTRLVLSPVTEARRDSERTDERRANIHFKRSVLAAEIIDRLHDEPTFGHVKFEKIIFLVEHLCNVDTGSAYHRDAAGPYDNRAIRSIDSQLRKQKWFDAQKIEGRYRYEPMANRGKHKAYFERYFAGISPAFDTVIDTFRSFTTERCEIVATLFAAWSDLLRQKGPISDDAIVSEVLHNWHESKKRIPEDRWRKALSWMRAHGFVPHHATGAV